MASGRSLRDNMTVRALIQGRPKAGKTGSLAALLDAGFKVRILDYNSNPEVLAFSVKDEASLDNLDVVAMRDRYVDSALGGVSAVNVDAFTRGLELLKEWKYVDPHTGENIDLGKSKDWGRDTILVIDTLDDMGKAAQLRAMRIMNKTRRNNSQPTWGFAMDDVENVVRLTCDPNNKFHVLIMSHVKMIGPNPISEDDDDATKEQKTLAAALVPTRLYPAALGKALPQVIGGHVPIILNAHVAEYKGKARRVFDADPTMSTDTGFPGKGIKWPQPSETALLEVFKSMGVPFPNGETSTPEAGE